MNVIGICGLARSGKDTVADYIERKYGYRKFVLSDVLRDELISSGKEVTKKNMAELGNELRSEKGNDVVARMLYERCSDYGKVTVVGFRSPEEVDFFEKLTDSFFLVEVRASKSLRVDRAVFLGNDDVVSRDSDDVLKKGLDSVFSMATIIIDNDSSLDSLHLKVDDMMREIG
ncbi:MAG: AAA family ATPase [archaeon]